MYLTIFAFLCLLFPTIVSGDEEAVRTETGSLRYFSPILKRELISLRDDLLPHQLKSKEIITGSETVSHQGIILESESDYHIDYKFGKISFNEEVFRKIGFPDDDKESNIKYIDIEYAVIPEYLLREFAYFISRDYDDEAAIKKSGTERAKFASPETDMNISGSKTFGFSIGSDEDFNINQSLFLRLDGELKPNLWIQAQISDTQSPLTPEGDTREISSLDQLFIRLYGRIPRKNKSSKHQHRSEIEHNEYEIAFGDLELFFDNTQFINHWSQFEGVKAEWKGQNEFKGAVALSKGKQSVTEFKGIDGKQGPYYISLPNIGTYVQVVAGSEEVFLDGIKMIRGNDYRIDYAEGSITFTSKHFIDSNSQIYIRFQYSDEEYRQYKYLSGNRVAITDRLNLGVHMIIETDDSSNPLQGELTEEDRKILVEAGNETAWADGIVKVEQGQGEYGKEGNYYVYKGMNQGDYLITFSYVGKGKGDYVQFSPGRFRYTGEGEGDWIPKRRLPSPEQKANYDVSLQWNSGFWSFEGEGLFSVHDRNTLSDLDKKDNDGFATHWQLQFVPDFDKLSTDFMIYYRFLSQNLNTFSDINDPELNLYQEAGIDSVNTTELGTSFGLRKERVWNSNIRYFRKMNGTKITKKSEEDSFFNDNLLLSFLFFEQTYCPQVNYNYQYYNNEIKEQQDDINIEETSTMHNNSLKVRKNISWLGLGGEYQNRLSTKSEKGSGISNSDSIEETGDRYTLKKLTIGTHQTQTIAADLFVSSDKNEILNDEWKKERESITIGGEGVANLKNQMLKTAYSRREVTLFHHTNETKSSYDMAEANFNSSILNRGVNTVGSYSLMNSEFYPKIRELVYVGRNAGIYDSTGVYSDDGEYDYIAIPTGNSEMSIDINADFNLFLTPQQIIKKEWQEIDGIRGNICELLAKARTETTFLRAENSRSNDKWDVYLLKPSSVMNAETTIYGKLMSRHTLWYDIMPRRLIAKLMLQNDDTLDSRYDESVETAICVKEAMIRLNRVLNSDFELTYEQREEDESRYSSEVVSNTFSLDVRNRVDNNLSFATLFSYSREDGGKQGSQNSDTDYSISSLGVAETISWFFQRKYRFYGRGEYRYSHRDGSQYLTFLPEKRGGSAFKWNTRLNHQLNKYTSATFSYSGNKYPLQKSIHTLKIELKAEF